MNAADLKICVSAIFFFLICFGRSSTSEPEPDAETAFRTRFRLGRRRAFGCSSKDDGERRNRLSAPRDAVILAGRMVDGRNHFCSAAAQASA